MQMIIWEGGSCYANVRILCSIFETSKEILKDVHEVSSCFPSSPVEDLERLTSGGMRTS